MTGAKKGRPKKRVKGPKPKLSSTSGDLVGYRNLSVKSKRVYNKEKKKEKQDPPATEALEKETEIDDDEATKQGIGRPPLDPSRGPMKEQSLKRRRVLLNRKTREDKKKKEHLSKVRKQAVNSRTDRQDARKDCEDVDDELEDQDLVPSERTSRRMRADFTNVLPRSLKRQAEILVKFVEDGWIPELSVVQQPAETKQTPKSSFYRYQKQVLDFLHQTKKKYSSFAQQLLLNWAKNLIISDRHLFSNHNLCFLSPRTPTTILAQLASDKIKEEMMAAKWSKFLRDFTITHAIRFCKEVSVWKDHHYGEIAGLAADVGVTGCVLVSVFYNISQVNI